MILKLHKNARTTPAIRRELRESNLPRKALAEKYNLSHATVRKWQNREDDTDRSHRPHKLHANLSPAQKAVVVALRQVLLLPLDDLLVVTREFINPTVSRSGLDRCLRLHGVSNLKALIPEEEGDKPEPKTFKDYEPGVLHVDVKYLPQMPDETQRRYLFAAIDRASRWVYVEVLTDKSMRSAKSFLNRLIKAAPFTIHKILTDNGKEFTDRFCATGERKPTGSHPFDTLCAKHGIEHRLIKPRHPHKFAGSEFGPLKAGPKGEPQGRGKQTNGMIERFKGRIQEVLATTRFDSSQSPEETLMRYVRLYNHSLPQRALGHITPIQALQNWRKKRPELFNKSVYNLAGLGFFLNSKPCEMYVGAAAR
jgi:transposase InsO family protein